MAIEIGAVVPMPAVARPAGRSAGAEAAKGGGSFASALSASNVAATADTASATPRGADRKAPARGRGEGDRSAETAGADRADAADATDATMSVDTTDADAAASTAAGSALSPASPAALAALASPVPSDLPSALPSQPFGDARTPPAQPDPSSSALLLAQSTLGSAAPQASAGRTPEAVSRTTPALQGVPSVAAGPVVRPGEAPGVPGAGATAGMVLAASATVMASEAASTAATAVAKAVVAVAPDTAVSTPATAATVAVAGTGEPDVAAPVASALRNPALRAATGPASDTAASASASVSLASPATTAAAAAQAVPVEGFAAPSTTAASSAAAQQAQRAVAQAVADRAAQQAPAANVASGRGAIDPSATAALAGAATGESSPLLRRFERVLSMTHAALGDAAAPGGGNAFATSAFTTPVDAAGASAGVASGTAERSAEAMNGWLAQVVAQKNQSASLTVEVGGRPVSVDVQVKGNEAQVVFRADQADTRALLAQAMPQLRQMMGAEGVVLSDASVAGSPGGGMHPGAGDAGGSGGSGGSSGGGASGRGGSPVRIDTGTAGVVGAGGPARPGGARSLDLYV